MISRSRLLCSSLPVLIAGVCFALARPAPEQGSPLLAGAASVDITPQKFPVRVNGMFTERTADKAVDPLSARALVLDNGDTRLALCVIDSCMVPRDLIDAAKKQASEATGIPAARMLVSSTHTHSAPSAMGCLGSRTDPEYAAFLPGKIAQAIITAAQNLQPARAGWTAFDDWDHTHNRRWIRRPDRIQNDPFGEPTVRANMHPGHQSPDVTGPSGPVDPQFTLLAVESADGKPLALLGNYSMHYQGSPLLSADYFGRFRVHTGKLLGAGDAFTAILSQGTSGDLWSGDYSRPAAPAADYDTYAREIAERAAAAYRKIEWHTTLPLVMAETTLTLDYRVPGEPRLAWARETAAALGEKLPQTQPEIYALEAMELHRRRKTELILQALRIGELGITALPNEVFCLTGLKLKARSPLPLTMNISLANGAEGYIPPPEQHALGGYTTWPARTAGLETGAEPKITEAVTGLLEKVSGLPRRTAAPAETAYAKAVMTARPAAFWRMEEMDSPAVTDATGRFPAAAEPGVALYLPGFGETPRTLPGSRAFHFAGGRVKARVPLGPACSAAFWFWNGLPSGTRPVTGYAFSRGADGDSLTGEHLGIGGTHLPEAEGRLILYNGNAAGQFLTGKTVLAPQTWHHAVLVREGSQVRVHLDGKASPDLAGTLPVTITSPDIFFGGRSDGFAGWEGKLDDAALFDRALTPDEITALTRDIVFPATPPPPAAAVEFPALPPEEALKSIRVPEGFSVELAACEPQVIDPVAIDWDPAGRLWVVEMADYPGGMDNNGKPGGRVRCLEDAGGDGTFEKSALFAENLNFPTGLLTWGGGVIVTAAPDILFLRDTDGDGRADHSEKLISGLSEGNQQLRANGLRWGLDNRIYCAAGGHHGGHAADTVLHSHRNGTDVKTGSRDFSFDPVTGDIRPESGPSQYGRNRDDAGHWFGTQNSRALWEYVLPDHYLQRNPHVPAPGPSHLIVTPLNAPVYPVSPPERRYHSFENANHFTSACSGMIYRDDLLFPRRGNELDAFTCEPFHNLVQHNVLTASGVTYTAHRDPGGENHDFFASTDRWCRPVMTRTGPDGALWVVDMYRYMIEHPAWLPEASRATLLPHYRLGDDKGRIYRVVRTGQARRPLPRLDKLSPAGLATALDSPNGWQRDKAHQLLAAMEKPLQEAARDTALRSPNPLSRLHGLALLPPAILTPFLRDPSPLVRECAASRFTSTGAGLEAFLELAGDPSPKVRLAFALQAGSVTGDTAAVGRALAAVLLRDHADPWMHAAVMSSAVPHCHALCEGVATAGGAVFADCAGDLISLAAALNDRGALAALLRPSLQFQDGRLTAAQMTDLTRFHEALAAKKLSPEALAAPGDALSAILATLQAAHDSARRTIEENHGPAGTRAAAAALLVHSGPGIQPVLKHLTGWLAPAADPVLQLAAVRTLAASGGPAVPGLLLNSGSSLTPQTRDAVIDVLLSREAWALALLDHLKAHPSFSLDATQRARLAQNDSKLVRAAAEALLNTGSSRKAVLEQFRPALQLKGEPVRGKAVFTARCTACHQSEGAGNAIGPDLKSVAGHPAEKLLTSIIDPSLDVQPGYFAFNARLRDRSELYGLITSETGNSLTFKLTGGDSKLVARSSIDSLESTGQSLMPAGLETGLTHQEMADLIAWLQSGGGKK